MAEAIREAENAAKVGEVPVGAVIAHNGAIIGRGRNRTEERTCVTHHAEILAIKEASKSLENWRLTDTIMCVTLEPCTMCIGAIRLARIPTVAFGAGDSRQGALGSLYDLSQDTRLGEPLRIIHGIEKNRCKNLLRSFFEKLRD
jgi:tRNA(adenine34) deaminase